MFVGCIFYNSEFAKICRSKHRDNFWSRVKFLGTRLTYLCMCLQKTDSLSKLYEMDESPERKAWLDKLLAFMDDKRTPITTCPTISKNPLDLFRLYLYVKERGGFSEVCKFCHIRSYVSPRHIKDNWFSHVRKIWTKFNFSNLF